MLRFSITILFIILTYTCLVGQVLRDTTFRTIDSASYADYTTRDWSKVIEVGKLAKKNEIDYFYLRMRLGIANYNLGYYNNSASNFEKALKFNNADQVAQLYLYDSYLVTGKTSKALKLSAKFNDNTKSLLPDNIKVLEKVYAGGGYLSSNNFNNNSNYQLGRNNDTLNGNKVLIGSKINAYLGLQVNVSPTFSFYFGYNHLSIEKRVAFQFREVSLRLDSTINFPWGYQNYFSVDTAFKQQIFDEKIYQNEVYLNSKLQFEDGWSISAFGNLVIVNSVDFVPELNQNTITDTLWYVNNTGPELFTFDYTETSFIKQNKTFVDYVVGLSLEKDINSAIFNIFGSYSSLNELKQYQLGLSSTYFLNKAATFYGTTGLIWFSESLQNNNRENRLIFDQKAGAKLAGRLWGEASIVVGNLNNANTDHGLIVYNQADNMKFKGALKLRVFISDHFELNLSYSYVAYEGNFIEFEPSVDNTYTYEYQSQNLIGGIVWSL